MTDLPTLNAFDAFNDTPVTLAQWTAGNIQPHPKPLLPPGLLAWKTTRRRMKITVEDEDL